MRRLLQKFNIFDSRRQMDIRANQALFPHHESRLNRTESGIILDPAQHECTYHRAV